MRAAQTFGHFEILERISVGGMAQVYRARNLQTGTIVALKRVLPDVAEDHEAMQMFEDEARICVHLEHPHIARMLELRARRRQRFSSRSNTCTEKICVSFSIARYAPKTEVPLDVLIYVFTRIGEGLAYAHARKDVPRRAGVDRPSRRQPAKYRACRSTAT